MRWFYGWGSPEDEELGPRIRRVENIALEEGEILRTQALSLADPAFGRKCFVQAMLKGIQCKLQV